MGVISAIKNLLGVGDEDLLQITKSEPVDTEGFSEVDVEIYKDFTYENDDDDETLLYIEPDSSHKLEVNVKTDESKIIDTWNI